MKAKWIFIFTITYLAGLVSCTELDNYDAPTGTIYGKVIDNITNEPILTEEPNGFRVRYIEQNYINPSVSVQNFYGKADGTFERGYIFPATYKVFPIEGAFFPVTDSATVVVEDNGRTEVNFTVTPYLNVTASAVADGNDIVITYNISRTQTGDKIAVRRALCSYVPTVSNTVYYKDVTTSLTGISDEVILETTYTDTIQDFPSGTYYVRAAARTNNANSRFNYSPVMKIEIP
jgi:hypothetical protein